MEARRAKDAQRATAISTGHKFLVTSSPAPAGGYFPPIPPPLLCSCNLTFHFPPQSPELSLDRVPTTLPLTSPSSSPDHRSRELFSLLLSTAASASDPKSPAVISSHGGYVVHLSSPSPPRPRDHVASPVPGREGIARAIADASLTGFLTAEEVAALVIDNG